MATPNEALDTKTRIRLAKEWLQERENETESMTTAARIFHINRTSLLYSIEKANNRSHGGSNRILTSNQEQSIHQFIQSYLNHGLLPTKGALLSAITRLRALENKPPPSNSWFQKWWKTQPLRKIKTKPIARVRITAQDKEEVSQWFGKYREALKKHKITRGNVWNFDETGFRVGCPKGEEIYVPLDVKEVSYYLSNKPILIVYSVTLLALKIDVL
jgi:hypothetical protein